MNPFSLWNTWAVRAIALWLLSGWLSSAAKSAEEFAGEKAQWHRYESPHVELLSRHSDEKSRRLLHRLELLQGFFMANLRMVAQHPVPLTVYYFGNKREFDFYHGSGAQAVNFAGYYLPGLDRAIIAVAPMDDSGSDQRLIFHEYVHHLVRTSGLNPPLWVNEGLAELYSTLVVKGELMEFGHPHKDRLRILQMTKSVPIEALLFTMNPKMLFVQGETGVHLFYAQAWALMHYLIFGDRNLPRNGVEDLLQRLVTAPGDLSPEVAKQWFVEGTGMAMPALQQKLDGYIRSGSYSWGRVPLPQVAAPETYRKFALSREDIYERLAELAFRMHQNPRGRFAFLSMAEGPNPVRALEVLGNEEYRHGNFPQARVRWEAAIAAGSQNLSIVSEIALMESRRWFERFDFEFRLPQEKADELRALLERSIAISPQRGETYRMLAWVEAFAPTVSVKNVNLVQRNFPLIYDKLPTLLALAIVRFRTNDHATAAELLTQIEAQAPPPWIRQAIQIVRSHLPTSAPTAL